MSDPIELQVLDALADSLAAIDLSLYALPAVLVFKRELDGSDPAPSIGIFFHSWQPVEGPQIGQAEPAIGRYRFSVQTFIKSSEREPGERMNSDFVKQVRKTIYRDKALRDALVAVRESDDETIERPLRWGIDQTFYTDSAITGGFVYLSQTEFYFETEVA